MGDVDFWGGVSGVGERPGGLGRGREDVGPWAGGHSGVGEAEADSVKNSAAGAFPG